MLPTRQRLLHPRPEALLPHDVHVAQPLLAIRRREELQRLHRVALEQPVRLRGDVGERDELPPSPRQIRQRPGELDAEDRALPGVVEDLARVRHPERHITRSQHARCELQERGMEGVCERDGGVPGEEGAELLVYNKG